MKDFLLFRKMIAPVIIQIAFWTAAVVCVIMGVTGIVESLRGGFDGAGFAGALATLLLGPVGARVYCELLIIVFRINENLTEMKKK